MIHGTVICPECKNIVAKYGLGKHMCRAHSKEPRVYKDPTQKDPISLKNSSRILRDLKKAENLNSKIINQIIKLNDTGKTKIEIGKELGFDSRVLAAAEKFHGFKLKNYRGKRLREKFREDLIKLGSSELGKILIEEYKKYGGTIKGIAKKHGLNRKTFKNYLLFSDIPIKDKISARREQAKTSRGSYYGKRCPVGSGKCHWFIYDGIKYQGSWEFKYGLWLRSQNITFLCHSGVRVFPYICDGKERTYCPDFYVPSWDKYIEIKGFFSEEDKEKIRIFNKTYPDIGFELYDEKKLLLEGILDIDKKININLEQYAYDYKTGGTYFEKISQSFNKAELIDDWIINKKSWLKKSKELKIPFIIFSKYMHTITPQSGSEDFDKFLINRYFNESEIIEEIKKGITKKAIAKKLNILSFRKRYLLVNRISAEI